MERPDALILTVGGTPDPLIESLRRIRPPRAVLLHTAQTADVAGRVRGAVASDLPDLCMDMRQVKDAETLQACYEALCMALNALRDEGVPTTRVWVDFTGGTKAMSAGAVLAAAEQGCRFVYVSGFKRNKEGKGVVECGTETVLREDNPWDVLEAVAVREALRAADRGLWPEALERADRILERCGEARRDMFEKWRAAVQALSLWDAFRHDEAWKALGGRMAPRDGKAGPLQPSASPSLPGILASLARTAEHPLLVRFAEELQRRLGALAAVCRALGEQPKSGPDPLIVDLVANADRRAKQGMLDEAYLRLYRALELMADRTLRRVAGYGTDAVPDDDLPEDLRATRGVYGDSGCGTCRLGLDAAYRLLAHRGEALGKRYLERAERLDISGRNESWLIHGSGHATQKQYDAFRRELGDFLAIDDAVEAMQWRAFLDEGGR